MSLARTSLLALTAAIALGCASLSPTSAHAGGGGLHKFHHHHHAVHWPNYRRHYYYAAPVVTYAAYRPARTVVSAPNPCSCLSKAYTPEGQVVFSDNCTKESAMSPVPGVQQQSEAPASQNFAGRTFQDFQNSQQVR